MIPAMKAVGALVAAALCLEACAARPLGPSVQGPLQTEWEAAPAAPQQAPAPATTPAQAAPANLAWWERFNDPVLNVLMRRALTQNLDLKLAQARILEARASRRAAAAAQWPVFTAAASDEFSHEPAAIAQPGAPQRDVGVTLDASWTVDLFGRARHAKRAAEAELRASQFDADNVKLSLLAEIATDYVNYRLYQSQYAISARSAASQAETVRITRVRFDQGAASRLDVARVESQLAITRAAVPQALEQAATARSLLVLLLATTPPLLAADLPDTVPETPNLPVSDPLELLLTPAEVIARRPDISAAEQRLLAAAANLKAALAERYPQFTLAALFGTTGSAVNQLMTGASRTASYGGGLTLPLFDFGRIRAAIDAADSQQLEAYITYEQTVRGALQATQSAVVLYAQGVLRARELATALDSARLAEKLARRQYQEGVLSLLEVLDAERTAYDTELTWSQSAAAVSVRLIDLYQMMGMLPSPDDGG
jgi:NodT family efflux transporter outer membrane factor (OMF) lipoprotein